MHLISNPAVKEKFDQYPKDIRKKMLHLRKLVLETAEELAIPEMEETLKWGEPSFLVKKGSTLRMDWKAKSPDQYAMYFKCTSKLVETFRTVYKDKFNYEKNRAIVFGLEEKVPEAALKKCIAATLSYHLVKQEKLLGIME